MQRAVALHGICVVHPLGSCQQRLSARQPVPVSLLLLLQLAAVLPSDQRGLDGAAQRRQLLLHVSRSLSLARASPLPLLLAPPVWMRRWWPCRASRARVVTFPPATHGCSSPGDRWYSMLTMKRQCVARARACGCGLSHQCCLCSWLLCWLTPTCTGTEQVSFSCVVCAAAAAAAAVVEVAAWADGHWCGGVVMGVARCPLHPRVHFRVVCH